MAKTQKAFGSGKDLGYGWLHGRGEFEIWFGAWILGFGYYANEQEDVKTQISA